jgi:hypothetical protein
MTSESQIDANRRNAQKSTGPKTAEGKAVAAGNSLRHGLTARQVVCFDETHSHFTEFYEALRADYAPADAIEAQLVERIALCVWRLRRACRMEAKLIDSCQAQPAPVWKTELANVLHREPEGLETLSRHEATLDRALQRAQIMLERRQARRRGEFVPAPIAVTVSGPEGLEDGGMAGGKPEFYKTKPILSESHPVLTPHPDPPPQGGREIEVGEN